MSVVHDIKKRDFPQVCSYRGREPIVCCTDCELVNDTSNVLVDNAGAHFFKTGKKAIDKCLEYMTTLNYNCNINHGLLKGLDPERNCYIYDKVVYLAAVGGVNALRLQYPHMALLGYGDDFSSAQWLCGGSVISDKYILTAGHCTKTNNLGPVSFVALGLLKRSDPPSMWQTYRVKRIIRHPQYNPPKRYHDIALLEVDNRIRFSASVLPACLDAGDNIVSFATATGWGALGPKQPLADTLQVVNVNEYTSEQCGVMYPPSRLLERGYDSTTQSCYGNKDQLMDTCQGDSGGPLQVSAVHGSCIYKIIGVTSFGKQCGLADNTGMYTRVAYYVPWIESIVWP
ncbi:venom protease-like isoform X2 [Anticarsia gemmatalis]